MPLNVTAIPVSKTSLLLEWGDPLIPIYFNYTVTVTLGQEEGVIYDIFQPALLLNLEGLECEPFEVTISMPGNCEAITVEGSLLVGKIRIFPLFTNLIAITVIVHNFFTLYFQSLHIRCLKK